MTEEAIIATIILYANQHINNRQQYTSYMHDDTALLDLSSSGLYLISTDQIVEDVHFSWLWCSASDVAFKLIQVNISDIFAKGGIPRYATLNLYLDKNFSSNEHSIIEFAKMLGSQLSDYNITLLGGDTTISNTNAFSLTVLGSVSDFIPRKNPKIDKGDCLYLLGDVGGSAYALEHLLSNRPINGQAKKKYTRPCAYVNAPKVLTAYAAKASIDLSDSLYKSLLILSQQNLCSFHVFLDDLPYFKEVSLLDIKQKIRYGLYGGEDLAILFIAKQGLDLSSSVSCIGKVHDRVFSIENVSVEYLIRKKKINVEKMYQYEFSHFTK